MRIEREGLPSSAYDGITFTTENSIKEDDMVVELRQLVIEKNGESKKSSYCDAWKFKDGMISQVTSFVIWVFSSIKLQFKVPDPIRDFCLIVTIHIKKGHNY